MTDRKYARGDLMGSLRQILNIMTQPVKRTKRLLGEE